MTEDDRIDLRMALLSAEVKLGGVTDGGVNADAIRAHVRGVPLTYRFAMERGNRVTEVDVTLPHEPLHLWVHVTREATVHSGGEPEEVVAELLDAELRERIIETFPVSVVVEPGRLRVSRPQWVEAPGAVGRLAALAADIAVRIDDAFTRAEAKRAAAESPYRGR